MRKLVIVTLVILLFVLSACSKGNVLTGHSVKDVENGEEAAAEPSEPTAEPASARVQEEQDDEPVLGDVEAADYSEHAGECIEGDDGAVRVIDADGVKAVYRNDCLGDKLVKYSCAGDELDTELEACPQGCTVERYEGRCK